MNYRILALGLTYALLSCTTGRAEDKNPPKYAISCEYKGGRVVVNQLIEIRPTAKGAEIHIVRTFDPPRAKQEETVALSAEVYLRICRVMEQQRVTTLRSLTDKIDGEGLLTYSFKVKRGDEAERSFDVYGPELRDQQPAYGVITDTMLEQGERSVPVAPRPSPGQGRNQTEPSSSKPGEGVLPVRPNDPLIKLNGSWDIGVGLLA